MESVLIRRMRILIRAREKLENRRREQGLTPDEARLYDLVALLGGAS